MSVDDAGNPDELPGEVITVTDLNADISKVIDRARGDDLTFDFVIGDVSNDGESNGNRYFNLVNDDAGIQCLAFSGTRTGLPDFEEGDRVAVKGRLGYYEARGDCSLYVDDVVLIGDSHYHRQIEELRESLSEEGLFDDELKKELPKYPSSIGIITSRDSDAEEDAMNAIHNRHPDVNIYLYNSRVQGIAALEEICTAITYFDSFDPVEIIVVTRGGGSEQDLHAFNTEGVSRIIAGADTPVVTAIGHENDRPVVDDVADDRAMTPTEIGSVVVPSKATLSEQVADLESTVSKEYTRFAVSSLGQLRSDLNTQYDQYVADEVGELSAEFNRSYQSVRDTELADLQNELETSYTVYKQEMEHQGETQKLQQRTRMYKAAVVGLLLLLVCVAVLLWFL